jgi:hypothetical protein
MIHSCHKNVNNYCNCMTIIYAVKYCSNLCGIKRIEVEIDEIMMYNNTKKI